VYAFGVIELERTRKCVEDGVRDASRVASLESGVVLGADAGEHGDFLSFEAGNTPCPAKLADPCLCRSDPRSARS
jgi:hypothetical protein